MDRQVVWANAAEEDLEAAAAYIHKDSPAYAATFVHQVLKASRSLCNFFERGRSVPEIEDKKIREIFVQSYRMIYHIEDHRISILALIHGRRNFISAWDEKER